MAQIVERGRALAPGAGVALVLALAATFLSEHYAAPVMLFALLLGLSFNFLADNDKTRAGVEFSAKVLLRIGVSLLGLRIGIDQIAALGWQPVVMVVMVMVVTFLMVMGAAGGGMTAFYAQMPDEVTLTVNGNHPIYQTLLKEGNIDLQKSQVRNLADLALLSQGLLKGNDLTNFINRSVDLLQNK